MDVAKLITYRKRQDLAFQVLGGICTLIVAALWARWFPAIRNADDLTAVKQLEPELHEAAKASMLD